MKNSTIYICISLIYMLFHSFSVKAQAPVPAPLVAISEAKARFTEWGPVIQDLLATTDGAPKDCEVTGIYLDIFELERKVQMYCLGGYYVPYDSACGTGYAYDFIAYGDSLKNVCPPGVGPITQFNGTDPNYTWRLHFKALGHCRYRFKMYFQVTVHYKYPPCLRPINLTATDIQFTTAKIQWSVPVVPPCCGYKYFVSTNTTPPEENSSAGTFTSDTSALLTNLTKNTQYCYWVRSDCDTAMSKWEGPYCFSTLESCPPPVNIEVSEISATGAKITWEPPATGTPIQYRYVNSTNPAQPTTEGTFVTADSIVLNNLNHSSNYYFWIRTDCDNQDLSNWTGPFMYSTNCSIVSIPHTQNFDQPNLLPEVPNCWTKTQGIIQTVNSSYVSAPNSVELYIDEMDSKPVAILSGPELASISSLRMTLRSKIAGGSKTSFEVGTISDTDDPSTFTSYITITTGTTWQFHTVFFEGYSGTNRHIAFRYAANIGEWGILNLDDIYLTTAPACVQPYLVETSEISYQSALINWASASSQWEIEWGLQNFQQGTGTLVSTSQRPFLLSGLQEQTSYSYYIRTACLSPFSYSVWSGPYTFKTTCGVTQSVPFTENFDGLPQNTIPYCWKETTGIVKIIKMSSEGYTAKSGENSLALTTIGSWEVPYPLVVTQMFDSLNTLRVRFWAEYKDLSPISQVIQVGTISDINDFSTFHEAQSLTIGNSWTEYSVSFAGYTGSDNRIAIRSSGTGLSGYIFIDDFIVEKSPACIEPKNLNVTDLTYNSAKCNWIPGDLEVKWNAEVGLSGFQPGNNQFAKRVLDATSTTWNVTNLTPDMNYEFYVQAVCGPTSLSDWTGPFSFKTLCNPSSLWSFPFTENFEPTSPSLGCWTVKNTSGPLVWSFQNIDFPEAGTQSAVHNGGQGEETLLISHLIQLPPQTQIALQFWSKNTGMTIADTNKVMISTDGGTTFMTIWAASEENFEFGSTRTVNLTSYAGNTVKIAFLFKGNTIRSWTIDNIKIFEHTASWTGMVSKDWHNPANWSNNLIPDSLSVLTVSPTFNQPEIIQDAFCDKIQLSSGASLIVKKGGTLTTSRDVVNNGNITVESEIDGDGSLLIKGNISGSGVYNIQRFLSGDSWHMVSTPVTNAVSGVFSQYWMNYWYESDNDFGEYISPTNIPLIPGNGFSILSPDATDGKRTFSGTINHGTVGPLVVTKVTKGFNMLGNPYPCSIDWNASSGWNKSNLTSSVYIWNKYNWTTYNGITGTNGGNQFIPMSQGFIVKALNTGYVSMGNGIRKHSNIGFRTDEVVPNLIRLKVSKGQYADESVIMVRSNASMSFDNTYDASKFYGVVESPQLYTIKGDEKLAIQALPSLDNIHGLPVFAEVGEESQCVIRFEHTLTGQIELLLRDILLDSLISPEQDYVFTAFPETQNARFEFVNGLITEQKSPTVSNSSIWQHDNYLYVSSTNNVDIKNIVIYNALGQVVISQITTPVNLEKLPAGIYIAKAYTNSSPLMRKIIVTK